MNEQAKAQDYPFRIKAVQDIAGRPEREDCLDPIPTTKTEPWEHQVAAYNFCKDKRGSILKCHMGTGKSKMAIDQIVNRAIRCGRDQVAGVILCPKPVVDVWVDEMQDHCAMDYLTVPLTGMDSNEKAALIKSTMKSDRPAITLFICGYEAAAYKENRRQAKPGRQAVADALVKAKLDFVIFDEVHKIKAPGGRASWFGKRLGKSAHMVMGLTGTLIPHSPLDIYAIYRAVEPRLFGTNFAAFKTRYAIMGGYKDHEVVGWRNRDELRNKIYSIAFEAGADVLDLPPAVHTRRIIELGGKARRAYDKLKKEFYAQVDGGLITVGNALTQLLRLQQITSGYIQTDDGEIINMDNGKAAALGEIMDNIDTDEPLVVFCKFTHDINVVKAAAAMAGRTAVELTGQANELKAWQDGKANVLAVQIQAGGVGVSFVRAHYQIYYSLGFSLADYEQSLARIHRPGQEKSVNYIHILAKDTVDSQVYKALRKRKQVIESILKGYTDEH